MDRLWDLYDLLCDMTEDVVKKGDISPSELENVYKATKAMYYITCIDAMNGADEYEGSSMARGMSRNYPYSSTRRGSSYRRSSRTNNSMRNYSGHDQKEMMLQKIAEMQRQIEDME
jgi:hypothetical protein